MDLMEKNKTWVVGQISTHEMYFKMPKDVLFMCNFRVFISTRNGHECARNYGNLDFLIKNDCGGVLRLQF